MAISKRYPQMMLSTALIPWTEDFQFDEAMFRKEVRLLIESGIKHIYIFGTAGEGYDMNTEEYTRIAKVFREEMYAPGLHPMVCVISVSPQLVIERIKIAYAIGFREFQLVLPCWGVVDDKEMMCYFHMVCDLFPDCQFIIYNVGRGGRVLGPDQFMMIAKEIPNVVAAKLTSPSMIAIQDLIRCDCPIQFIVIDFAWALATDIGECGYLVALAAPNAQVAKSYFEAGLHHDHEMLLRYQKILFDMRDHLIKVVGNAMDGTYDKMTLKLVMPEFPLRLRPPYHYPSETDFITHRDFIRKNYPDWNV